MRVYIQIGERKKLPRAFDFRKQLSSDFVIGR